MSDDIVARLREADEWMLIGLEGLAFSSNAPFEAADEIERLRAELAAAQKWRDDFCMDYRIRCDEETKKLIAERDALRELLKEAREYLVLADADGLALLARIDAALNKGDRDE